MEQAGDSLEIKERSFWRLIEEMINL